MARTKKPIEPPCDWWDDGEGNWTTSCGEFFIIIDGTPTENRMRYCHHCGRKLREVAQPDAGQGA